MSASQQIEEYINNIKDWRGELLKEIRKIILDSDSEIIEEWKWGSPVWSHKGSICSASAFKDHVKVSFFNGAKIVNNKNLFNSGLEAKNSRTIDYKEGDTLDRVSFQKLLNEAISLNINK